MRSPRSRGAPAQHCSAPAGGRLCCHSPQQNPLLPLGSKCHQSPAFPRAARPRGDAGPEMCPAGPQRRGEARCLLPTAALDSAAAHGGPRAFFSSDLQTPFPRFSGDLGAAADFCSTAALLPRPACICKAQTKLHPQGGSGFELQIKRNFQPSDVGCRMQLHRFGRPPQAAPVAPCPPPPPPSAPFPVPSSHPNLPNPSAALPGSGPDISAHSERGLGRP